MYEFLNRYRGNSKGLFFILFFRISNFFTNNLFLKVIGFPFRLLYRLIISYVLGVDVSDTTIIGKNFVVWHCFGLVIHPSSIVGDNVTMRHNTTIGNSYSGGGAPFIGDNVNIGSNSVLIGDIKIGNNSIIGAGSVVTKDVPAYSVVVGNPAIIIRKIKNEIK